MTRLPLQVPMKLLALQVVVLAGCSIELSAQMPSKPGTVEVSLFTGGSFDFPGASAAAGGYAIVFPGNPPPLALPSLTRGRKSHPIIGVEMAVSVTRYLWIFGDYGYMFPDHKEATAQIPVVGLTGTGTLFHVPTTGTTNRKWWTATGGLEVSAPSIHRVVPFVRIGGGYVHHSYDYTRPEFRFPIGTIFPGYDFNRTDVGYIPTVNFGAGLRWYHSERRGVRILVDGFRLSRSVEDIAVPESRSNVGYLFVNSRGGGRITIGYFIHF